MATVNSYDPLAYGSQFGQPMTSQPQAQSFGMEAGRRSGQHSQPLKTVTITSAGTLVAMDDPSMMIVYNSSGFPEQLPITGENLCKVAKDPVNVNCPHCSTTAVTEQEIKMGCRYFCHFFLFLIIFAPYIMCCLDNMKDRYHHCGNCKRLIAKKDWGLNPQFFVPRR